MSWFRKRPRTPGSRSRFGFRGPFPTFRTRTRRGSEVSVSGCGCCLPIPLLAVGLAVSALRGAWRLSRRPR